MLINLKRMDGWEREGEEFEFITDLINDLSKINIARDEWESVLNISIILLGKSIKCLILLSVYITFFKFQF